MRSFESQTHYEVLEVSVGASAREIQYAYERLMSLYGDDQVALYGLIEPDDARALRERLKEALDVLGDEDRRDRYDASIGLPPRERPASRTPGEEHAPFSYQAASPGSGTQVYTVPVSGAPFSAASPVRAPLTGEPSMGPPPAGQEPPAVRGTRGSGPAEGAQASEVEEALAMFPGSPEEELAELLSSDPAPPRRPVAFPLRADAPRVESLPGREAGRWPASGATGEGPPQVVGDGEPPPARIEARGVQPAEAGGSGAAEPPPAMVPDAGGDGGAGVEDRGMAAGDRSGSQPGVAGGSTGELRQGVGGVPDAAAEAGSERRVALDAGEGAGAQGGMAGPPVCDLPVAEAGVGPSAGSGSADVARGSAARGDAPAGPGVASGPGEGEPSGAGPDTLAPAAAVADAGEARRRLPVEPGGEAGDGAPVPAPSGGERTEGEARPGAAGAAAAELGAGAGAVRTSGEASPGAASGGGAPAQGAGRAEAVSSPAHVPSVPEPGARAGAAHQGAGLAEAVSSPAHAPSGPGAGGVDQGTARAEAVSSPALVPRGAGPDGAAAQGAASTPVEGPSPPRGEPVTTPALASSTAGAGASAGDAGHLAPQAPREPVQGADTHVERVQPAGAASTPPSGVAPAGGPPDTGRAPEPPRIPVPPPLPRREPPAPLDEPSGPRAWPPEQGPVSGSATPARGLARARGLDLPPTAEFNGGLLRQVRMARGVTLSQLSERTRISVRHLENVEADRYEALPATVYLRGILMSLARELGLDGLKVSKSYLAFVEARRTKG